MIPVIPKVDTLIEPSYHLFFYSITECVVIWFGIVLAILPSIEMLHFAIFEYKEWEIQMQDRSNTGLLGCFSKIPVIVIELYRILGYFFIGALGCLLTTELAKYKIGRLRPYYLTGKHANKYEFNSRVSIFMLQSLSNA